MVIISWERPFTLTHIVNSCHIHILGSLSFKSMFRNLFLYFFFQRGIDKIIVWKYLLRYDGAIFYQMAM